MRCRHEQEVLQEGRPLGVLRPAGMFSSAGSIATTVSIATTAITASATAITAAITTERRRLAAYERKHQRVRSL